MLGDPDLAEDASQEAIVRALLSLETLRQPERFGAWLGGIGLNVCRHWRRERAHAAAAWSWEALVGGRRLEEPPDLDPWVSPERSAEERDLARVVQRAVDAQHLTDG